MALSGQSETEKGQGPDSDIAVQDKVAGDSVQTNVGLSFIERLMRPVPAHIGKSIKLTQGHKITLLGPSEGPYSGRTNGFYKHGFSLDLLHWLEGNVGGTVGHHLWEEGEGDWLYQGSRWGKADILFRGGTLWLDFRIRDRRKAMMFKLSWYGHL